ncbi:hypothetical protein L544_4403 [Bordetella hinzii OH87 BAL007II]|uniref:Uncharacterized protein n=1 Tax=Bordetella hinzii OH87 BAL007II TaxID=1331262 RepID=A0ABR4QZC2_9BORD|nr:hypothetical protein L544_4403 [Bordetella hinzii OH87 BAL007II]
MQTPCQPRLAENMLKNQGLEIEVKKSARPLRVSFTLYA